MPFGIDMATTVGELEPASLSVTPSRIPSPHPLLANYSVEFTPPNGVQQIVATSGPIDGQAIALLQYEQLLCDLRKRYGQESFSDDAVEEHRFDSDLWADLMFFRTDFTSSWFESDGAPLEDQVGAITASLEPSRNGAFALKVRYLSNKPVDRSTSL
jgi:hypothetical protein